MSPSVSTRYYRSPEIIVCETEYDFACDIWSVGCIVYELIHCSQEYISEKESAKEHVAMRHAFTGDSCYPISPFFDDNGQLVLSESDQFLKILRIKGAANPDDLSFVTNSDLKQYAINLHFGKGVPSQK